jgi:NTE family protein
MSASEIHNRINEVSFNATLLKELKMISLLRGICESGDGEGWLWAQMRLHIINSEMMVSLGASSKLNAEWAFLEMLRDEGRRAAAEFGARHKADIGVRSTFDFESLLEGT